MKPCRSNGSILLYCTGNAQASCKTCQPLLSLIRSFISNYGAEKNMPEIYTGKPCPLPSLFSWGGHPLHQGAALQPTDHQTGPGTPFFVNLQALSFTGRPCISDVFGFLFLISWYMMIHNSLNFILPASWILWASSWLDVIKSHLTFAHSKTARRIQYRYLQSWVLTLGMLEGPGVRMMKMKPSYDKMFQIHSCHRPIRCIIRWSGTSQGFSELDGLGILFKRQGHAKPANASKAQYNACIALVLLQRSNWHATHCSTELSAYQQHHRRSQ